MSKTCQNVDLGGSPGKCKKHIENVNKNVKMSILEALPENVKKMSNKCKKKYKCSNHVILGPHNDIFDIFGDPKSTPPGHHLTFCFDCIRHFPGTLPNPHFNICLTFSGKSRKTPVTLGSSGYGIRRFLATIVHMDFLEFPYIHVELTYMLHGFSRINIQ